MYQGYKPPRPVQLKRALSLLGLDLHADPKKRPHGPEEEDVPALVGHLRAVSDHLLADRVAPEDWRESDEAYRATFLEPGMGDLPDQEFDGWDAWDNFLTAQFAKMTVSGGLVSTEANQDLGQLDAALANAAAKAADIAALLINERERLSLEARDVKVGKGRMREVTALCSRLTAQVSMLAVELVTQED